MDKPMSSPHLNVGDLVKLTPDGANRVGGLLVYLDDDSIDAVGIITRRRLPHQHLGPLFEIAWLIGLRHLSLAGGLTYPASWLKHWEGPPPPPSREISGARGSIHEPSAL